MVMKKYLLALVGLSFASGVTGLHETDLEADSHRMTLKFAEGFSPSEYHSYGAVLNRLEINPFLDSKGLDLENLNNRQKLALKLASVNVDRISVFELKRLCEALEAMNEIEYCSLTPVFEKDIAPPFFKPVTPFVPLAVTPDYSGSQGYLMDAATGVVKEGLSTQGINAEYAWDLGVYGEGVTFRDAEGAWNLKHEDLANLEVGIASTSNEWMNHGTNTIGVLMAQHNGFGVNGATPNATMVTYSVKSNSYADRDAGVTKMVLDAEPGDILILEMQDRGCQNQTYPDFGPADYRPEIWEQVNAASADSVIVIAAAGNGNQNLDGSCYSQYRDRGDNGSIIVGGGTPDEQVKTSSSTYGSKVRLQGWGYYITTTGNTGLSDYDLPGVNGGYTTNYSGTSGATPIVVAAVGLVQSWAKKNQNRFLGPYEMRELLVSTGNPQGGDKHIGPLPNVKAAIEKLDDGGVIVANIPSSNKFEEGVRFSQNGLEVSLDSKVNIYLSSGQKLKGFSLQKGEVLDWSSLKLNQSYLIQISNLDGTQIHRLSR